MSANYEVWLNARHPKTLESIATVRVFASPDRVRCEEIAEVGAREFVCVTQFIRALQPGALMAFEVRRPDVGRNTAERMLDHMQALEDQRTQRRAEKQLGYEQSGDERRTVTAEEFRVVEMSK